MRKILDVESFLTEQSIDFTITIKPITVNTDEFSNTVRRKIARVSEQNSDNGKYSVVSIFDSTVRKKL